MSIKIRLQRLEDSQKAKSDEVSYGVTAEQERQTRQWLDDTIRSINEGTPGPPPSPPSDQSSWTPKQIEAHAHTMAWLDEMLNAGKTEIGS